MYHLDVAGDIVETLRAELAERPLAEASSCPSWPAYVRALRRAGEIELAEWLALALHGVRREDDRKRLRALQRQVLGSHGELANLLFTGALGWSQWLGPFVLAYVGPAKLSRARIESELGPLARLLTPERIWIDGRESALTHALLQLERGDTLLLPCTLPGLAAALCEHVEHELRELVGPALVGRDELSWTWDGFLQLIVLEPVPPPAGSWAVIELDTRHALSRLHAGAMAALEGAVVIGPPELLREWPSSQHTVDTFGPAPQFERRHRALAGAQPGLFSTLRAELDTRSAAAAHTCPSWPVLHDYLASEGHELFAEWLDLDLRRRAGQPLTRRQHKRLSTIVASFVGGELAGLPERGSPRIDVDTSLGVYRYINAPSATWLGPFVVSWVDPELIGHMGADELQARLGLHAALLPRSHVFTDIDASWLEHAGAPSSPITFAPVPAGASALFATMLVQRSRTSEQAGLQTRWAPPGERLETFAEETIATNIGPIAPDREAIGLLCCETKADLRVHIDDAEQLQSYRHLVLIGPQQVLEAWPQPGTWIPAWQNRWTTDP